MNRKYLKGEKLETVVHVFVGLVNGRKLETVVHVFVGLVYCKIPIIKVNWEISQREKFETVVPAFVGLVYCEIISVAFKNVTLEAKAVVHYVL